MKHRRIKFFISLCCWSLILLRKALLKTAGIEPDGRCTAVYYHSVKDNEKEKFMRQIKILKKYAVPLRADFEGSLPKGKNCVILTFDDGFKSLIKNILPELKSQGVPCVIFFPVDYLGRRPGWEFNKRFNDEDEVIMTAPDIKDLPRDLVLTGSHSSSHRNMTGLNPLELKEEFTKSKKSLEALTGSDVNLFSFPYGDFNARLIEQAMEAGYKRTFTGSYEVYTSELHGPAIGRVRVDPTDSILEFKLKILGAYEWMHYFRHVKEKFFRLKGKTVEAKKTGADYRASEVGS